MKFMRKLGTHRGFLGSMQSTRACLGPVWLLSALAYLISCTSFSVPLTEKELGCREVIQYQISSSFIDDERKDILEAFDAWSEATGGATCFIPGPDGFVVSRADTKEVIDRIDQEAWDKFQILFLIGWAEEGVAWIFPYRMRTKYEFFNTAIHEIGHLLGISHYHGDESSYMHPLIGPKEEDRKIHQQDKQLICSLHPCRSLPL